MEAARGRALKISAVLSVLAACSDLPASAKKPVDLDAQSLAGFFAEECVNARSIEWARKTVEPNRGDDCGWDSGVCVDNVKWAVRTTEGITLVESFSVDSGMCSIALPAEYRQQLVDAAAIVREGQPPGRVEIGNESGYMAPTTGNVELRYIPANPPQP